MNCWKTINVTRQVGINRIYLFSLIMLLLSFIFLYLPFSIIHQSHDIRDHGMFPLIIGLILLPLAHKLMHILPLLLVNRRIKFKCSMKNSFIPNISLLSRAKMSKNMVCFVLLAPTLFLTIPGLISSYLFADYYVYFLIFTSFNIGLSFTDFLYTKHLLEAPKKCIIENAGDGYDILVQ
ncbi:DUF3267 domain-containing protein [Aquibacillus kalidii]|uniref:DUF3267 domain-containing protein n=1 Tax=Aquibacillus kalidii TaxID=2762597 RepID=UPI0016463FCE|nr:DUF3267 domain-containing protein [Aquibacillus kalidii]